MTKPLLTAAIGGGFVFILLAASGGGLWWLASREYRPAEREPVPVSRSLTQRPALGQPIELYSWNIGYASLDASQDFFMDGGRGVRPATDRNVGENMWAVQAFLASAAGDIVFLQEVDIDSKRSYHINQAEYFSESWKGSTAFAYNYKCPFVPVPFPHFLGRIESGILILNNYGSSAERISLPSSFKWPERLAQLKRCLLVERLPLAGEGLPELVLVNFHLEAYDSDGSGRQAQTKMLAEFLAAEYARGNYCVAGGDFNQVFPALKDVYPLEESAYFTPGVVDGSLFDEGWILAADPSVPSCRSLDRPYTGPEGHQFYIIDGFILSPNVELIALQTQDLGFRNSDHNPVKLTFRLK